MLLVHERTHYDSTQGSYMTSWHLCEEDTPVSLVEEGSNDEFLPSKGKGNRFLSSFVLYWRTFRPLPRKGDSDTTFTDGVVIGYDERQIPLIIYFARVCSEQIEAQFYKITFFEEKVLKHVDMR